MGVWTLCRAASVWSWNGLETGVWEQYIQKWTSQPFLQSSCSFRVSLPINGASISYLKWKLKPCSCLFHNCTQPLLIHCEGSSTCLQSTAWLQSLSISAGFTLSGLGQSSCAQLYTRMFAKRANSIPLFLKTISLKSPTMIWFLTSPAQTQVPSSLAHSSFQCTALSGLAQGTWLPFFFFFFHLFLLVGG